MKQEICDKIRQYFSAMSIYKDPASTASLFAGRNLPAFVKDFLLKRFLNIQSGEVDKIALTDFLNKIIPSAQGSVKDRLQNNEEVVLLARFIVYIDIVKNERQFSIPDYGIKQKEGIIPEYVYNKHAGDFVEGERWGIVKLCLLPDIDGKKNHIQMIDYKPFKPYSSVDINYLVEARRNFSTEEWIDVLLSAMEYDPDGFDSLTQKVEFLTRLLIFLEPRLNVIELAPKGTGKSFVYGNLSKYGWLVSGGKVTRAKLFFDKTKQQNGIIKNHDFTVFDEIQTIVFQEPAEIQAALKSYLESGKTTIDNNEFSSECGLMLMGNIPLTEKRIPISNFYFENLPMNFRESALLDRFHCFIEGWLLPRITKGMIFKGWTINVEYFSEILHTMRTQNVYSLLFDKIIQFDSRADVRDSTAIKRIATGYMKLFFPHWQRIDDINIEEFENYCMNPAVYRRSIIKEQCHRIDPEFKTIMPKFWISNIKGNIQPSVKDKGVEENELF
ncbi:MAG: BREX system Lon protease-like protein BrxL [Prevotella sp.]|jgi:ATP-dependent Lon protease|nr:BREX system Lon protease-like protein BrxL [Prevotella sp.]